MKVLLPREDRETTMMISNLSDDLESEILSRVPAKSLWELRATCKRWYTLFRDPKFVEKNKKKLDIKAARESILLINHEVYSISRDLHIQPLPIEFTRKLTSLKGSKKDLKFADILYCDGLVLCSTKGNTRLVVWNPCTGQKRSIKPRTCYRRDDDAYALGSYITSPGLHSWFFCYQNEKYQWVNECEIYDLSSDSWRVLDDSFPVEYSLNSSGVSLNGDTYWVAERDRTDFFLIKFDFTAERFVRLPLPTPASFDSRDTVSLSAVRDEKLSLLQIDESSGAMRIWVSNKIVEEDKDDFSLRSDVVLAGHFDEFNLPGVASFLLDEESKVAVCCDGDNYTVDGCRTSIFVVGEDMCEEVYEDAIATEASDLSSPVLLTCLPSLVLIQPQRTQHKRRRLSDSTRL